MATEISSAPNQNRGVTSLFPSDVGHASFNIGGGEEDENACNGGGGGFSDPNNSTNSLTKLSDVQLIESMDHVTICDKKPPTAPPPPSPISKNQPSSPTSKK